MNVAPRRAALSIGLAAALGAACSTGPVAFSAPALEVPSYSQGDPRTQSAGFVQDVRLVEVERGDTRFILMAFVVGDVLTVGAMTQGPFEGVARWTIGERVFEVAFEPDAESGDVSVSMVRGGYERVLLGSRAGFRGYQWINVELDVEDWMRDSEFQMGLEFRLRTGESVSMPETGVYRARCTTR